MASSNKKLDEYHLKVLRELVTLNGNKQCFDCHQRGPTYVNVTIGSFVCTTCSGLLRGLTPPHRVKSISMAKFTPEEIDLIKKQGNEYCRKVWLGLCDNEPPTKDEQQIKDFMISKYEQKRYHLSPSNSSNGVALAQQTRHSHAVSTSALSHPSSLALKPPPQQVNGSSNSSSKNINNNNSTSNAFTPDQLFNADFSKVTQDPFSSSSTAAPEASFANFDNNPIFDSTSTGCGGSSDQWRMSQSFLSTSSLPFEVPMRVRQHSIPPPANRWSFAGISDNSCPTEDRYAALKDLDCLMKSQKQQQQSTPQVQPSTSPPEWGINNKFGASWPAGAIFGSSNSESSTSNPFTGEKNVWTNSNSFSANPFRNGRATVTENVWSGVPNGQHTNGFPTSQSLNFMQSRTAWNNETFSNPFSVGSSTSDGHRSSNPFL
ncbi:arf-GAP domain and FG repeat-containing protein 1 isoform X1 [Nilaparvata lugens]|uniref:arf-GAP domain and FG repeat-containing protein 1 isoform X1 n=1 Tax=Nilaparvata lugens TaxID=108931 RepID=UPI00193E82E9|nr:arf-GAP domain and FG repeat-containing protein 1 isoform X1 [Nilaparvata lugens]